MGFINELPVVLLAFLIFTFRIVDVSLGTLRTISVVQGRINLSVGLGFFEVLIWITAVSQVISGISSSPLLLVAYAGGFAAGNAVGILLERRLALGTVVVRLISPKAGLDLAATLRQHDYRLTTFAGEGRSGPVHMIYLTCPRRDLPQVIEIAHALDPKLFYAVETARERSSDLGSPLPYATGWRGLLKKK
jgi:uncharacterized protein YebE (UPF0316 family)